jgi:hypothetical protein
MARSLKLARVEGQRKPCSAYATSCPARYGNPILLSLGRSDMPQGTNLASPARAHSAAAPGTLFSP